MVVTERGCPIAVLSPVAPSDGLPERLVEMEREGLVRVGAGHLPEGFLRRVRVKDPEGRALQVLQLDRTKDFEVLGCVGDPAAVLGGASEPALRQLAESDPHLVVWWGTSVECVSAIARLRRDGGLSPSQEDQVVDLLSELIGAWTEVQPTEKVRLTATGLLRIHPLQATDVLQLSAAHVWAVGTPLNHGFVCLDSRLREAARLERFAVLPERSGGAL